MNNQKTEIIFISDLHLAIEKKEITRRFLDFLQTRACSAQAIYILGDLFDTWIGDDDTTPPINRIKSSLKQLTESGTRVFFLHGNRDFLIADKFCNETGIEAIDEYTVIDLNNTSTLLTHGDLLCTDDTAYQAFRKKSRTHEWQQNVLSKPLLLRLIAARWYRFRSYFHKRKKSNDIMDVNQETVEAVMRNYGCHQLIHGHTHRPATHHFRLDKKPAARHVLAEWKKQEAELLCWNPESSFQRIKI